MEPGTFRGHKRGILSLYLSKRLSMLTIDLADNSDFLYDYNSKEECAKLFQNREYDMVSLKKSITMLRDNSGEDGLVSIGFHSKDPVLELRFIRDMVEYCNSYLASHKIEYTIETNLGLLTDEVLKFLDRENFKLLIDIDPSSLEDLGNLDSNLSKNIIKIKRDYKGLYKNTRTTANPIEDASSIDSYNTFLSKRKKAYRVKDKSRIEFRNKEDERYLDFIHATYEMKRIMI